jgi:hypothetical protein
MANCPADPVAPRINTDWPGVNATLSCNDIHEDIPGFMAAASRTGSTSGGTGMLRRGSITVCSAIDPNAVSRRRKYTSQPSERRPTPSIPAMKGSSSDAA